MSSIGRKVKLLRMHQTYLIEGFGNVNNPLNFTEKKNGLGISGVATTEGILITAELQFGKSVDVIMPWGNIVQAVLEPKENNVVQLKK